MLQYLEYDLCQSALEEIVALYKKSVRAGRPFFGSRRAVGRNINVIIKCVCLFKGAIAHDQILSNHQTNYLSIFAKVTSLNHWYLSRAGSSSSLACAAGGANVWNDSLGLVQVPKKASEEIRRFVKCFHDKNTCSWYCLIL